MITRRAKFSVVLAAATLAMLPSVSAQAQSWTGFYAGINMGGAWSQSNVGNSVCSGATNCYFTSPFVPADAVTPGRVGAAASGKLDDSAFTIGGQIGYNWQMSNLVLGVEGDLNSMRMSSSRSASPTYLPGGTMGINLVDTVSADYMGTVRGRIGYATANLLMYFTGGFAFTNFKHSHSGVEYGFGAGCNLSTNFCDVPFSSSLSTGWTVGGGAEWALDQHWSIKAEYLYADFGSVKGQSDMNRYTIPGLFGTSEINHSADFAVQTVRAGLNYRF